MRLMGMRKLITFAAVAMLSCNDYPCDDGIDAGTDHHADAQAEPCTAQPDAGHCGGAVEACCADSEAQCNTDNICNANHVCEPMCFPYCATADAGTGTPDANIFECGRLGNNCCDADGHDANGADGSCHEGLYCVFLEERFECEPTPDAGQAD